MMSLFDAIKNKAKSKGKGTEKPVAVAPQTEVDAGRMAELALKSIQDGVIIINKDGLIKFINPAGIAMTGVEKAENALNLDFSAVMKFEFLDGTPVEPAGNELLKAAKSNSAFETKDYVLVATLSDKRLP